MSEYRNKKVVYSFLFKEVFFAMDSDYLCEKVLFLLIFREMLV